MIPSRAILIVASETWHKGVVGLVASRLVERFRRPACVIAWEATAMGTGSLRSVPGIDLGAAIRAAVTAGLLGEGRRPRDGSRPDRRQRWPRGARAVSAQPTSARRRKGRRRHRASRHRCLDRCLRRDARADGSDRACQPVRPGQLGSAFRVAGASRQVRQAHRAKPTSASFSKAATARASTASHFGPPGSHWAIF